MEQTVALDVKKMILNRINMDTLAVLVKERPVIWDSSEEHYRNKDFSAYAWHDICRCMFDAYDDCNVEMKQFLVKTVKQRWTTARDVWQRTYRKYKEAILKGENVSEPDNPKHEQLKFLTKVYDKYACLQPKTGDKQMECINLDEIDSPLSPDAENPGDPDTVKIDFNDAKFRHDLNQVVMRMKPVKNHSFNQSFQNRKPEKSDANVQQTNEWGNRSPTKTTVVNVEDRNQVGNIVKASKRKHFSNGYGEAKVSKVPSSPSRPITSPNREEVTYLPVQHSSHKSHSNNQPKNNLEQTPQYNAPTSPVQTVRNEDPFTSRDSDGKTASVKNESKVDQSNRPDQRNGAANVKNTTSCQIEQFIQIMLRPSIQDFDKPKIMEFLFEILKPLTANFDRRQLLNFQIDALQLVRKIEGDHAT